MQVLKALHLDASHKQGEQQAGSNVPVDSRAQRLTVAGFDIEGVSIAGQETCIIVSRAKCAFDIGRCPQRAVFQQTVLITHGHLDHVGGLPFHVASRGMANLPPSKIVLPPPYVEDVTAYLESSNKLQGGEHDFKYSISSLQGEHEIVLDSGFSLRAFPTSHTIHSQGYCLYSLRKKLRQDLQGRSQEEIRQLRLSGEEVTETIRVPEIAFTGDTTAEFLEGKNGVVEDALRAKVMIMEMTFIDQSVSVDEARERGHMHIADLCLHAHRFANEAILLIHFSARYKRAEILAALAALPSSLRDRCFPLLNGFSG